MIKRRCKRNSTKILYCRGALLFSQFLKKGLDEIVDEYRKDAEVNVYKTYEKWEEIFEDFGDELTQRYSGTTPTTYFEGAKALINTNVPKSVRIKPQGPETTSRTIPPIAIDDLRMVREAANIREKAFIDFLKDSGISRADALSLNYSYVKKAVESEKIRFLKIDVFREKENVEYEAWIGPNAIDSLRLWFTIRKQRGETITDDTPIFASNEKPYRRLARRSLSQIFRRLGEKVGKKISTHRLRKFFETYIAAGGVHPIVAKYWMGHKVRSGRSDIESKYIIPPEPLQRDMYAKAYSYIDLNPQPDETAIWLAETKARMERMDPQQRKRFIQELSARRPNMVKELIEDHHIKALLEEKENEDCANGEHCSTFKEIAENDLLVHLNQGWKIEHNLQNGNVIIRRGR